MNDTKKNIFLAFLFLPFVFASCTRNKAVSSVAMENLFSLEYGNFEDELNMFNLASPGEINTGIAMRDGFFYIADSQSKKIMEMNSYGDLVSLYYNEEFNPAPEFVSDMQSGAATRKAINYPFNQLSAIAVDAEKRLYVVDKLPAERREFDESTKTSLSQIVLRFDTDGNFIDYLGQQGPGGLPFPFIKDIYVTKQKELVVVCLLNSEADVYWFSDEGFLLYKVIIKNENIPNPYVEEKSEVYYSASEIVPDMNLRMLYLKIDYYSNYIDESSHVQSGIEYLSTQLYPLNVETGIYEHSVSIPPYTEQVSEGFSVENFNIPYDFMGVTDDNWMFFMVASEEGLNVQMVQSDGQKIIKRKFPLNRSELYYYTFDLSNTGIISALLVQKDSARVNWWRTDNLIQSMIKK